MVSETSARTGQDGRPVGRICLRLRRFYPFLIAGRPAFTAQTGVCQVKDIYLLSQACQDIWDHALLRQRCTPLLKSESLLVREVPSCIDSPWLCYHHVCLHCIGLRSPDAAEVYIEYIEVIFTRLQGEPSDPLTKKCNTQHRGHDEVRCKVTVFHISGHTHILVNLAI